MNNVTKRDIEKNARKIINRAKHLIKDDLIILCSSCKGTKVKYNKEQDRYEKCLLC